MLGQWASESVARTDDGDFESFGCQNRLTRERSPEEAAGSRRIPPNSRRIPPNGLHARPMPTTDPSTLGCSGGPLSTMSLDQIIGVLWRRKLTFLVTAILCS